MTQQHNRLVVSLSPEQKAFHADRPLSAQMIRQLIRQHFLTIGESYPADAPVGVRRNQTTIHGDED